jgi:hypothetical protein
VGGSDAKSFDAKHDDAGSGAARAIRRRLAVAKRVAVQFCRIIADPDDRLAGKRRSTARHELVQSPVPEHLPPGIVLAPRPIGREGIQFGIRAGSDVAAVGEIGEAYRVGLREVGKEQVSID